MDGERGKEFRFHAHVTNVDRDIQWVDVYDDSTKELRAFRPDRVKPVIKKRPRKKPKLSLKS